MATPLSVLLRLLFPSWAFFDIVGEPPSLEVLVHHEHHPTGVWQRVVYPARRRWWHILFNPAGTRTLAAQTVVERCYAELISDDGDAASRRGPVAVVDALAAAWVRHEGSGAPRMEPTTGHDDRQERASWQWRIIVRDAESGTTAFVYVSDVHTVSTRTPRSGSAV